jgi:zinc protease
MRSIGTFVTVGCSFLMVLQLSACSKCGGSGVSTPEIRIEIKEQKLKNGLRVIVVEDPETPVVSYQTWVRAGSVDEVPGKTGIAHLFEHLMFKGTLKFGPKEFFRRLEAKGAEVNAYTTRDYTVYYENFTPGLLDEVIELESDRLTNLALTEGLLNTERQVVMEERRLRTENSPTGRMQEALWQIAYSKHPYQWPVIGYAEDLNRLTVDDLVQFYQTHYQPGNVSVIVVGAVKADEVFAKVRKAYEQINGKPAPARKIEKEPEQTEERKITLYDQVASQRFAVGYVVSSADQDDSYALDVMCNILFSGQTSRAHRTLVEEKDIVLGVGGSAYTPTFPGLLIYSGTMKGSLESQTAIAQVEALFDDIKKNGVTDEELAMAQRQLTLDSMNGVRTPSGLAQLIGTVTAILGDPNRFREDLARYRKVTSKRIQAVASKYLKAERRNTVILMPEEIK